jgi:hypothetical protein
VAIRDLPILANSITAVPAGAHGAPVVCASHGGRYSAACALALGASAAVFSDAGKGLEGAGVAGLRLLQQHGIAALTASHNSARIGDGRDMWERGVVSALNETAQACGVRKGMAVCKAWELLPRGVRPAQPIEQVDEARHTLTLREGVPVVVLDSNSLVTAQDAGAIVVTGSHGGLLGGDPATAIKHPVFAAVYNDADVGIDGAGISRLPALDARGIAGIAVDAWTARIGDGMSTYNDGVVSHVNNTAAAHGARAGMTVQALVECLADAWAINFQRKQA